MSLNKLQAVVKDREAWNGEVHRVARSQIQQQLNNNNKLQFRCHAGDQPSAKAERKP